MNKPFKISVHSDGLEYIYPATDGEGLLANNRGFSIGMFYDPGRDMLDCSLVAGYYQRTSCLTRPTG